MANLLSRIINPTQVLDYLAEAQDSRTIDELRRENISLDGKVEVLQEGLSELSLYLEDLDWTPLVGLDQTQKGLSLDTIRENSERLSGLLSVNPTIKKAVNARIGYIWGRGVEFSGSGTQKMLNNKRNKRLLFSPSAQETLEKQLATDGNVWAIKDKTTEEVRFLPMEEISGWVLDEFDQTRVIYWLHEYTIVRHNFSTGEETVTPVKVFYAASDYTGAKVASIDGIRVDRNVTVSHLKVNAQRGWLFGMPDIMAAMFWAKAHKELFEAGTTYVKAQGKFASKVVSKTKGGAGNAAARIAEGPHRDLNSGEVLDSGGTAVMSGGLDYQLMGKMSGGVDFDKFDPVAALVAVGLDIPLSVIIGTSENDEKALERTTVDAMQMRQKLWTEFYEDIFGRKVKVAWPKIRTEPEYRRIQALEITNKTGALSREEIRQLTLEAYDLDANVGDLPKVEDNWAYMIAKATADNAAKHAEKAAEATVPEQGVDAGVGKLSTGGDAKASRDDSSDKNTQGQ